MPNARRPHPGDEVGDDLSAWVEDMSDYLADALLASSSSPETARMTEAEKTRYFSNQVWTPEGLPNKPGRDRLVVKHGWQGFARILTDLDAKHRRLSADVGALPEPETGGY